MKSLVLADPEFNGQGQIEVLLGAPFHASIIEGEVRKGGPLDPIAMNSKLGWIVSGNSGVGSVCGLSVLTDLAESCISFDLEKFWRQEEIFDKSTVLLTPEEQECENFFINTHYRDENGRYVVRLPFRNSNKNLTFRGSFAVAEKMLSRIEDRFDRDAEFAKAYHNFFSD